MLFTLIWEYITFLFLLLASVLIIHHPSPHFVLCLILSVALCCSVCVFLLPSLFLFIFPFCSQFWVGMKNNSDKFLCAHNILLYHPIKLIKELIIGAQMETFITLLGCFSLTEVYYKLNLTSKLSKVMWLPDILIQ